MDLGCGEESFLSSLAENAVQVIGVDHREMQGPYGLYLQADLNRDIPVEAESMDLAASKFLLEHLEMPDIFLRKVHASLQRGGWLVIMTPNVLYYPYGINLLLSRLLTQEKRMRVVELFSGRAQQEIFPVYYRCNTPRKLRRELIKAGFEVVHLGTYSDCEASAVVRPLGMMAVAYEKAVASLGITWARGFLVAAAIRK
jgi:ubiquinone/menaquinone biosynthesis C-methylase UbiE